MNVAIKFEMPVTFANLNHAPQCSPFESLARASDHARAVAPRVENARFEVGKTYFTRSICDHDTIYKETIVRRTEKSIWTAKGKRFGIGKTYDGHECFKPHGNYSMCAVISANRELKV